MNIDFASNFADLGYAVTRILNPMEAREVLQRLRIGHPRVDWPKAKAAVSPEFYSIGSDPRVVDRVAELVGEDVMLWGCCLVQRRPGKVHPWHTDVESGSPIGRTVSVWLGLENTSSRSSLQVVSRSHRFGISVQELAASQNVAHEDLDESIITRWAYLHDPQSRIDVLDVTDGEAVFFDGRLWHGTSNASTMSRTALLLQYATPDTPIRMPKNGSSDWPFLFQDQPRPPCVMVRGSGRSAPNRIVPPPHPHGARQSKPMSWIRELSLPLSEADEGGWKGYPIYLGPAKTMTRLSCHASVLSAGCTPHPPHQHQEEEILVVLSGAAELVLLDETGAEQRHPVRRGDIAYYPAGQHHTIHNPGGDPASYMMYKWKGTSRPDTELRQSTLVHNFGTAEGTSSAGDGFERSRIFSGPTQYLRKLHCHVSTLNPAAGYEPHVDGYDVSILVLDGWVETLGQRIGPNSVVYYAAGEPHGMLNVGSEPAHYIVFEFHGPTNIPVAKRDRLRLVSRTLKRARRFAKRIRRRFQHSVPGSSN